MAKSATLPKTNIRPLGDRVVVKATEREEQTKSGLFLPDTVTGKAAGRDRAGSRKR